MALVAPVPPMVLSLHVPCRQLATPNSQDLIPLISLSSEQYYKLAEYLFSPHLNFFSSLENKFNLLYSSKMKGSILGIVFELECSFSC